ncbi:MAG: hypothetical protein WBB19_12905 [Desulforhopalus sp.]
MGKIALLPCDIYSRGRYLANRDLPLNYMGDFTLMGFIVDRYQDAITLLTAVGYRLEERQGGTDICFDTPEHLLEIKDILTTNNITCNFGDIADTLYQA